MGLYFHFPIYLHGVVLSTLEFPLFLFVTVQIGATEDLKCLFVLLIRQYNPRIQNKQYLQDLIITNHILLLFLDNVIKLPEYKGNTNLMDHIKQ